MSDKVLNKDKQWKPISRKREKIQTCSQQPTLTSDECHQHSLQPICCQGRVVLITLWQLWGRCGSCQWIHTQDNNINIFGAMWVTGGWLLFHHCVAADHNIFFVGEVPTPPLRKYLLFFKNYFSLCGGWYRTWYFNHHAIVTFNCRNMSLGKILRKMGHSPQFIIRQLW